MIGIHIDGGISFEKGGQIVKNLRKCLLVIYDVDKQFCDDYMNISQIHFILE